MYQGYLFVGIKTTGGFDLGKKKKGPCTPLTPTPIAQMARFPVSFYSKLANALLPDTNGRQQVSLHARLYDTPREGRTRHFWANLYEIRPE